MALLDHGIRVPEDVKVVTVSHKGFGSAYIKPLTRFESDPTEAGEKISEFVLAVLAKVRASETLPFPENAPMVEVQVETLGDGSKAFVIPRDPNANSMFYRIDVEDGSTD